MDLFNQNNYKNNALLGKNISHAKKYNPAHLFPVPRKKGREEIGIGKPLPFSGVDIWNAYEISWLDKKGKPRVAIGKISFPITTENLVESKSLKLYLNSFNQTQFKSSTVVVSTIKKDLSNIANGDIAVSLTAPEQFSWSEFTEPEGICIDEQDINIDQYELNTSFLNASGDKVEECLFSHLMRSNCPVTGQPDWATVIVDYTGPEIDRAGLLKYIVSFREHSGFHENCVERIFMDISSHCHPEKLSVYARYTRRGGIDINPFRSSFNETPDNRRLARQ
ncbi:MAG: NADPH-dependent 7-cyano-7-deazaguanine reductase QueF [Desulfobacterales bacterium]|nr:NADPH-dependent 7-cyano-7-deazaguanine reductase QueF [Desulfobacterales bacterium]